MTTSKTDERCRVILVYGEYRTDVMLDPEIAQAFADGDFAKIPPGQREPAGMTVYYEFVDAARRDGLSSNFPRDYDPKLLQRYNIQLVWPPRMRP